MGQPPQGALGEYTGQQRTRSFRVVWLGVWPAKISADSYPGSVLESYLCRHPRFRLSTFSSSIFNGSFWNELGLNRELGFSGDIFFHECQIFSRLKLHQGLIACYGRIIQFLISDVSFADFIIVLCFVQVFGE